jgi:hypothetical protein
MSNLPLKAEVCLGLRHDRFYADSMIETNGRSGLLSPLKTPRFHDTPPTRNQNRPWLTHEQISTLEGWLEKKKSLNAALLICVAEKGFQMAY